MKLNELIRSLDKCKQCSKEQEGLRVQAYENRKGARVYCISHEVGLGKLWAECSNCFPWMQKKHAYIETSPNEQSLFMYCTKHLNKDDPEKGMTLNQWKEFCEKQLHPNT